MKKNNRGLIVSALLWGILLSIFLCFPRESLAQIPPPGCSASLYGCTGGYVNCPGTIFCCPDLLHCQGVAPTPTPTTGSGPIPPGCSASLYGCTGGYVNCPGTITCCPNLSYCQSVTPYITPPPPPAAGGEEGIDFEGLSGAIPSLKPIFQAGPASNVGEIISTILPYLFVFAGLLLLFYLIYGGFHMMIAAGDEKGLALAKGKITNALIGFLLLFISYWLVQVVEFILGIQIF